MSCLAIEADRLTKRFPPRSGWRRLLKPGDEEGVLAVDEVSLAVPAGEILGLLGPNGAGKSTLVRLLCTLILPTSGEARIAGHSLSDEVAVKAHVGLAAGEERSFYWRLSGQENLRFYGTLQGLPEGYVKTRIAELDRDLDLGEALAGRFDRLSTGMRRRLDIARALLHNPPVLFLDEPTRSLDPGAAALLHEQVRRIAQHGHTVFLVTHSLEEAAALCHRVAIMQGGRLRAVAPVADLRRMIRPQRRYVLTLRPPDGMSRPPWSAWPWPTDERPAPSPQRCLAVDLPLDRPLDALLEPLHAAGCRVQDIAVEEVSLEEIFRRLTTGELPAKDLPAGRPPAELPVAPAPPPPAPAPQRLPPLRAALLKGWAFLRRDLQIQLSYRLATLLQLFGIVFSVSAFYFVARVFGPAASPFLVEYGGDYFPFVLVGIAFGAYEAVGMSAFAEAIRSGQTLGTLEAMLVTPTRLETILASSALWSFLQATAQVLAYLAVGGLVFGAPLGRANTGVALLTLLLSLLAFSGLGIISASIILVTKRGDPVAFLLASLSALLSGVYYPVAVLPTWLQSLAALLPLTHALRALRLALLEGAGLSEVAPSLAMLALFALVVLPGGIWAFRWALRRARSDGTLTQY